MGLYKTIGAVVLGAGCVAGFSYAVIEYSKRQNEADAIYQGSFDKFSVTHHRYIREPSITSGDVDGDGDLDIIIAGEYDGKTKLMIIENKMPQKNLERHVEKEK